MSNSAFEESDSPDNGESTEDSDVDVEESDEEIETQSTSKYQASIEASTGNVASIVGDNPNVTINYYIGVLRDVEKEFSDTRYDEKNSNDIYGQKDELIKQNLTFERQTATFFGNTASETKTTGDQLPEGDAKLSEWYYTLDIYDQCYVQATAVLHGAPAHDVSTRADFLYKTTNEHLDQHEKSQQLEASPEDQQKDKRGSSVMIPRKPSRELQKNTHTTTRRVNGVERVFWEDVDPYGLSRFGPHVLTFLANEFLSKGEHGETFLQILQRWAQEKEGECYWRVARALGVVLWYQNVHLLRRQAKEWAKPSSLLSRRRAASLLDGAYEIECITYAGQAEATETSSVLQLLDEWIKQVHLSLNRSNINLGCTIANTYGSVGKRSPEIALDGLDHLLQLPQSTDTDSTRAIYAAVVSAYVSLTWSGHIRSVLACLASNAEQLARCGSPPRNIEERQQYRLHREIHLNATFDAFFFVAAAAVPNTPTDMFSSYTESLPEHIAIPDRHKRDLLLAAILTKDAMRENVMILLCAAVISIDTSSAFELMRRWANIVLAMQTADKDEIRPLYTSFIQFMVDLGKMIDTWCCERSQQGFRSLPATAIYKRKIEQWQSEGHSRSDPIETLASRVLEQINVKY